MGLYDTSKFYKLIFSGVFFNFANCYSSYNSNELTKDDEDLEEIISNLEKENEEIIRLLIMEAKLEKGSSSSNNRLSFPRNQKFVVTSGNTEGLGHQSQTSTAASTILEVLSTNAQILQKNEQTGKVTIFAKPFSISLVQYPSFVQNTTIGENKVIEIPVPIQPLMSMKPSIATSTTTLTNSIAVGLKNRNLINPYQNSSSNCFDPGVILCGHNLATYMKVSSATSLSKEIITLLIL